MRAADLFCGAGGASMGLWRAGFEVEGWDIKPQKNYPFKFHLCDALDADLSGFDFVWASPPCQAYSMAAQAMRNAGKVYPDLMAATRAKLEASRKLYIIENVPGAPMRCDVMLCGSMFGLKLVRHRIFETNWPNLIMTNPCQHPELAVCVVGNGTPSWVKAKNGGKCFSVSDCRAAMGIDWMNRNELSQGIPPVYSEFLARSIAKSLFMVGGAAVIVHKADRVNSRGQMSALCFPTAKPIPHTERWTLTMAAVTCPKCLRILEFEKEQRLVKHPPK